MAEVKTYLDPKQASIEEQVAVKCCIELICAGYKLPNDLHTATMWCLRKYLQKHLGIEHGGDPDSYNRLEKVEVNK